MEVKFYDFPAIFNRNRGLFIKELDNLSLKENDPDFEEYLYNFESDFAKFVGTKYAIGVHSGTGALQLSLLASGIKKGDEIITTSNTFIATALAISNTGAKPVFCDINPLTFNIDINDVTKRVSKRSKAIIPVHLYGNPCDMDSLIEIAEKHDLKIIEDACQSHGAEYKTKKTGSLGDAGCFSFYTYKVLGGFGNGGMVTTNNKDYYQKIRELRDPESNTKNVLLSHRTPCYLDAIQIAIIKSRLSEIEKNIEIRHRNAEIYNELLKDTDIILPRTSSGSKHVFFSYVIRTNKRDQLRKHLQRNRIHTEIEYRVPIHMTDTFSHLKTELPVTEKVADQILSLPINEFVKPEQIRYVCRTICDFLR